MDIQAKFEEQLAARRERLAGVASAWEALERAREGVREAEAVWARVWKSALADGVPEGDLRAAGVVGPGEEPKRRRASRSKRPVGSGGVASQE